MNPMISTQLKQITGYIEELRDELDRANTQSKTLSKARDELQKKSWAQAKELAVFKEGMDDLAELRKENEELNALNDNFEQRLRRILADLRSLAFEYHP